MAALQDRQLELIERMAALDPPPWFMGGWAEDAVLAGEATRPHVDLDWLLPRTQLEQRLAQAAQFGFASFETWGESAPGEPFYLYGESGELKMDLGVADEDDGSDVLRIHKLFFDVDGREPVVGYQIRLPEDTFEHPPVELHGISIRTASPLALYQLRAGIASAGSFGPLSERQQQAIAQLHASASSRSARLPSSCPRSSRCRSSQGTSFRGRLTRARVPCELPAATIDSRHGVDRRRRRDRRDTRLLRAVRDRGAASRAPSSRHCSGRSSSSASASDQPLIEVRRPPARPPLRIRGT